MALAFGAIQREHVYIIIPAGIGSLKTSIPMQDWYYEKNSSSCYTLVLCIICRNCS